ncbi:MAG TPA: GreA/GreB family elongation factor [Mycobacteriales bacterium]|jgi:transcription elongation factor GreA|nr:GreA/GreB family elongation factor [Mycobacteriales bacterium]
MTLVTPPLLDSSRAALQARLEGLLTQRVEVFAEATSAGATGDAADRAGNVEAIIRLEELDARIAALHAKLSAPPAQRTAGDTVQVGSRVTLRFGGESEVEPFLVGVLEEAVGAVEVITPASPLGKALLGARSGDEVAYRSAAGATLTATLVDVDG